jgi:hypothetical protein
MNCQRFLPLLILCCSVISTCHKPQKKMMVSTGTAPTITSMTSVTIDGNIIDLGEGAIQYGRCYGKTPGVDITDSITNKGVPTRTIKFTSELKNLEVGITYYVKACISDGIETVYGLEINAGLQKTLIMEPELLDRMIRQIMQLSKSIVMMIMNQTAVYMVDYINGMK